MRSDDLRTLGACVSALVSQAGGILSVPASVVREFEDGVDRRVVSVLEEKVEGLDVIVFRLENLEAARDRMKAARRARRRQS